MRTHGQRYTPFYRAWVNMRQRTQVGGCEQERKPNYAGVECDPRWDMFEGFRDNPPGGEFKPGMVLSRIGDTGPYSPENTRWLTKAQNSREARERNMRRLPDGRFALDVALANGVNRNTMQTRINRGWPLERAVGETT